MPSTSRSIATWRRILVVTITALIAMLAVSATAPTAANAFMSPTVVRSSHQGWVHVRDVPRACPAIYPAPAYCSAPARVTAWQWTYSGWQQSSIGGGTRVYAWPYSGQWHWIWTQQTGWLAIETARLETGYRCDGPNCPVF
jgi:hypothetical protein